MANEPEKIRISLGRENMPIARGYDARQKNNKRQSIGGTDIAAGKAYTSVFTGALWCDRGRSRRGNHNVENGMQAIRPEIRHMHAVDTTQTTTTDSVIPLVHLITWSLEASLPMYREKGSFHHRVLVSQSVSSDL